MRREGIAKLLLACVGICACGSIGGMGLANYTTSGSFEFYRQQPAVAWERELPAQPTALQTTDLAFASDRLDATVGTATEGALASFDP